MMLARHLLETDHLSVSDVADRLGYSCPANFSRDFKQHVGIAASEARWREATLTREQPERLP
jgi:AraC-like DNA-binding protein